MVVQNENSTSEIIGPRYCVLLSRGHSINTWSVESPHYSQEQRLGKMSTIVHSRGSGRLSKFGKNW